MITFCLFSVKIKDETITKVVFGDNTFVETVGYNTIRGKGAE